MKNGNILLNFRKHMIENYIVCWLMCVSCWINMYKRLMGKWNTRNINLHHVCECEFQIPRSILHSIWRVCCDVLIPGTNHKSFELWLNWNRINNQLRTFFCIWHAFLQIYLEFQFKWYYAYCVFCVCNIYRSDWLITKCLLLKSHSFSI